MSARSVLIAAGFDAKTPEFAALLGWAETAGPQLIVAGVEDALFEALRSTLTRDASEAVLREARTFASRKADELAVGFSATALGTIGQTIADGAAEGIGPLEVARNLDVVRGLDPPRARSYLKYQAFLDTLDIPDSERERRGEVFFRRQIRARRQTIATTEGNHAVSEAAQLQARDRGQNWQVWITKRDDRVSLKICARNEAAGWIPITEEYPSGHSRTPGHPRCRCSIAYRTLPPSPQEIRRAELASMKTARELGLPDFDLSLPSVATMTRGELVAIAN